MWYSKSRPASANRSLICAWHSEPILGLGVYLRGSPWRLGPAWAVLAGALAGQAPISVGGDLLRLGGSLLLADALWGVLWQLPAPSLETLPKRERAPGLPYAAAHSPMVDVLSGLHYETTEGGGTGWQGTLAGIGFAAVLSTLLGTSAIVLSLFAIIASVGIRLMVRRGKKPALLMALLSTGLPWALGAALGSTGDVPLPFDSLEVGLALGASFTFLTWSVQSVDVGASRGLAVPVWLGPVAIVATLIALREPLGTALVSGLLIVPCLWISRRPRLAQDVAVALRASDPWWLASMLVAALAVRF